MEKATERAFVIEAISISLHLVDRLEGTCESSHSTNTSFKFKFSQIGYVKSNIAKKSREGLAFAGKNCYQ